MTRQIIVEQAKAFDDRFSDGLKAARKSLAVSRRELGDRCGLPDYTIAQIETGYGHPKRRRATIGEAIVLAEALGMKPGDLIRQAVARD